MVVVRHAPHIATHPPPQVLTNTPRHQTRKQDKENSRGQLHEAELHDGRLPPLLHHLAVAEEAAPVADHGGEGALVVVGLPGVRLALFCFF